MTRGGYRPGAGAKKKLKDPVRFGAKLEKRDMDRLRKALDQEGITLSDWLREVVRIELEGA